MNLKLGWKKGKGISMASIRERNGKFNVIYNYKDDSGKRRQKWETYDTKAEAKKRKREIEYKQEMGSLVVRKCNTLSDLLTEYVSLYGKEKWALSTYEGNVGLIRNYIEPMIGSVKLSEINTRFMERYYQGLLQTKAVGNPVKGNKKNEFVSASTVREIHKLLRNCFEQAIKWEMIEKNPCTYATVPKHKSQKREIWTAETLMYAMDVCEDERVAYIKAFVLSSFPVSCDLCFGTVTWCARIFFYHLPFDCLLKTIAEQLMDFSDGTRRNKFIFLIPLHRISDCFCLQQSLIISFHKTSIDLRKFYRANHRLNIISDQTYIPFISG